MTEETWTRLARMAAVALGAFVLAMMLAGSIVAVGFPTEGMTVGDRIAPVSISMFGVVGLVLTLRVPRHPFGWILLLFAGSMGISGVAETIPPDLLPSSFGLTTWLSAWTWLPGIALLGTGLLVFPDGRLPSRRWRVLLGVDAAMLVLIGALAAALWPYRGPALVTVDDAWPGMAGTIGSVVLPLLLIGFLGGVISLFARYRRGDQTTRLQLKWLLYAVAMLALALVLASITDTLGVQTLVVQDLLGVGGLFFLPIAVGIAVLRYRLFEIDRIISRTMSYGLVTAILVAVYAGTVLAMGSLLPGDAGDLVVATSTLLVAALFQPLRRRIQGLVDRRFNRARYDAQATVNRFGSRARTSVDVSALGEELVAVVATTMHPSNAFLWMRPTGQQASSGKAG